jgi:hypothetical protein
MGLKGGALPPRDNCYALPDYEFGCRLRGFSLEFRTERGSYAGDACCASLLDNVCNLMSKK